MTVNARRSGVNNRSSGSELLTAEEMSRADASMAGRGRAISDLMQAAGRAVASAAARLAPDGRIVVVAGRGNNGGDGFVAARLLRAEGRDVAVALLCRRESLKGDAARAAAEWQGPMAPFAPEALQGAGLIIDAIFGAGLNRELKGEPRMMIEAINASATKVLSIDLPSGINADSGAIMGAAVQAARTITFFRRKLGHLLLPGRMHCGSVEVVDIGIAADVLNEIRPSASINAPALWGAHFPMPKIDGHKYGRGHAVVVSGGISATGAARLAARGALRAGAGLVTVASPPDALIVNATALTAIMVRKINDPGSFALMLEDKRLNSLVIGPGAGVGERTRQMVMAAINAKTRLVLDADALTSFTDCPDQLFDALKASVIPAVLTPHAGEFRRLFKELDCGSKVESARRAAAISSAVIVLKGPDTVVAAPDGRVSIADNAPPWLATAGSGDVLAGFIAGLQAQNMPAFEAACAGVWIHGEAGQVGGPGLIAEDLPEAVPGIYRRLFEGLADHQASTT